MEKLFDLFYQSTGVSTDTRKIEKDNLFVALKGENFNGNEYAQTAIEEGAKFAIVDEEQYANNTTIFLVPSGLEFLQKLAHHHRQKFDIPVIGITGTNGKTTTKELIAAVLSKKYSVLYTKGNLNNHIGVPLTLLQLNGEHEMAIIEMGASHVGDIKELTNIAVPNFGIITNIGHAHIEGFGSYENIIKTKTELYQAVSEVKGHLFLNAADEVLQSNLPSNCTYSTYSLNGSGMVNGEISAQNPFLSFEWARVDYTSTTITTQLVGKYNLLNILAAICIGRHFEVDSWSINRAIEEYHPTNNRSQLEKTANNTILIDCYNANPTSTTSSLENFAEMEGENKMFILGDMLELGKESAKYHQEIVSLCHRLKLQGIFVGNEYKKIAQQDDKMLCFASTVEVEQFLKTAAPKNNLILLKGSRGIGLEKLLPLL